MKYSSLSLPSRLALFHKEYLKNAQQLNLKNSLLIFLLLNEKNDTSNLIQMEILPTIFLNNQIDYQNFFQVQDFQGMNKLFLKHP